MIQNALSPNSAACLFEGEGRRFFVKGIPAGTEALSELAAEHRIIQFLVAAGFPTPPLLADESGKTIQTVAGRHFSVFDCALGEPRYAQSSVFEPYRCLADAQAAGGMLARFHLTLAPFSSARRRASQGPLVCGDLLWEPDLYAAMERFVGARAAGARIFFESLPAWRESLTHFAAMRPSWGGLGLAASWPVGVIHGDWIKRNFFFSGEQISAVVDFDRWDVGPWVLDLALAISAAAFAWPRLRVGDGPHVAQAATLLGGYERVRPLSGAERHALVPLVATGRFEFHLSLALSAFARGELARAAWFFAGQVASLRWWRDRGLESETWL